MGLLQLSAVEVSEDGGVSPVEKATSSRYIELVVS